MFFCAKKIDLSERALPFNDFGHPPIFVFRSWQTMRGLWCQPAAFSLIVTFLPSSAFNRNITAVADMVTKLCRLVSFIFRFLIYISKKQPLAAELISSYIGSLLLIDQSISTLVGGLLLMPYCYYLALVVIYTYISI